MSIVKTKNTESSRTEGEELENHHNVESLLSNTATVENTGNKHQPPLPSFIDLDYLKSMNYGHNRPLLGLGAGDSSLLIDVIPKDLTENLFQTLRDEVEWHEMSHAGGPVPRLVSMQGTFTMSKENEIIAEPIYRHPADEQPPLHSWTPTVDKLRQIVSQAIGQPVINHALIQWYRGSDDFISGHADKTLDIQRGTFIINLSVGATRQMVLREKKGTKEERQAATTVTSKREAQRISLIHASAFVLGWKTNETMTHEIRRDRRPTSLKTEDELAFDGQRISLTFRTIATFQRRSDGRLFGQGAPHKTEDELDKAILVESSGIGIQELQTQSRLEEERHMIHMFGLENRSVEFDWDSCYGQGFSVLNMRVSNEHGMT